ncbi:Haspin [Drosophila busckii]|uniref:non-specific serine/threonine protein kinase n=1 Tax=Drosophila busckii TaxID=30019 RepID=A0A0M5J926_DROBS|nr:Haspin [Drosophila busckii]
MDSVNITLPDDAWKDSFDKLLDPRPQLRELNIIKRNVRRSFNFDSSVENSNSNLLSVSNVSHPNLLEPKTPGPSANMKLTANNVSSISTPCPKRLRSMLFDCALSPIGGLKLDGLIADLNPKMIEVKENAEAPIRKTKQVCFKPNVDKPQIAVADRKRTKTVLAEIRRSSLVLQPGKWQKNLITWRRTCHQQDMPPRSDPGQKQSLPKKSTPAVNLEATIRNSRKSVNVKTSLEAVMPLSHEKQVLKYCNQRRALRFGTAYAASKMIGSSKIGEGVYGEVFKYTPKNSTEIDVVLKVIPIEGEIQVNGETQKTFEQILPEIIISKEMCNLRDNQANATLGYVDIYNVCLVKGHYPDHLIHLWEDFDSAKESENEHPEIFSDSQLFIVLELKYAGTDLSTFTFLNAEQSYYALQQIASALAVGEEALQFEHRDLHWGNILIEKTDNRELAYKLNGKDLSVKTKGIKLTIIDYTLSRVTVDENCHYNDLSVDEELFEATGDYQYDIYRMMRDELKNDWSKYAPKTNVFWISYINSKLIDGVKYRNPNSKTHKLYLDKLKTLQDIMLTFSSAGDCIRHINNCS